MLLKKVLLVVLLVLGITAGTLTYPAQAGDLANGAKVFSANCAACHMGGKNMVNPAKTLKKTDLEKYSMASLEAIQAQVTNGKAAMPSFKARLNGKQIEDVAAYVLAQAEKGW
ncbi:cytochrome c6 PetJ [Aerosakkonema funiforme]|uniref:Cytochrome c6 n=1 Tax=Aerosakkonema funiforme FACHB-1375 TaxID=2949571 RepID=A0A926VJS9_9CYAN|nr:c-type cytochrome [Aerosakkonema funiforme]MBD2185260.1 c-type cytochrome [Aerosakkonema funiforme FACHB-1375]